MHQPLISDASDHEFELRDPHSFNSTHKLKSASLIDHPLVTHSTDAAVTPSCCLTRQFDVMELWWRSFSKRPKIAFGLRILNLIIFLGKMAWALYVSVKVTGYYQELESVRTGLGDVQTGLGNVQSDANSITLQLNQLDVYVASEVIRVNSSLSDLETSIVEVHAELNLFTNTTIVQELNTVRQALYDFNQTIQIELERMEQTVEVMNTTAQNLQSQQQALTIQEASLNTNFSNFRQQLQRILDSTRHFITTYSQWSNTSVQLPQNFVNYYLPMYNFTLPDAPIGKTYSFVLFVSVQATFGTQYPTFCSFFYVDWNGQPLDSMYLQTACKHSANGIGDGETVTFMIPFQLQTNTTAQPMVLQLVAYANNMETNGLAGYNSVLFQMEPLEPTTATAIDTRVSESNKNRRQEN